MMGIYGIWNKINSKIYVGQAQNIDSRWNGHKKSLKRNKHNNQKLQNAWNKYSEDNFEFMVLEEVENSELLTQREDYWMEEVYDSRNCGYNIKKATDTVVPILSEEAKRKISEGKRGVNHHSSRLIKDDVLEIVEFLKQGETPKSIAEKYNISKIIVLRIKNGERYSEITGGALLDSDINQERLKQNLFNYMSSVMKGKCIGEKNGSFGKKKTDEQIQKIKKTNKKTSKERRINMKLTDIQVDEILLKIDSGIPLKEIAFEHDVSYPTIRRIRAGCSTYSRD